LTIVVLLLSLAWAALLVRLFSQLSKARAENRPVDSIISFRRQLRVIQRTAPGGGVRPAAASYRLPVSYSAMAARQRTLKRRRDVLASLLVGMGVTLVLGFLPQFRILWGLHLILDVLFGLYIALLIRIRNQAAEREMKLRFLPGASTAPQPAFLLRRSAN
jgi:hypothetical protein